MSDDYSYLVENLGDKWWRMNNLYKIEDENGQLVTFKMRPAQEQLFREMNYKNIILKARQLGFSTSIDIYILDEALFSDDPLKCGIVAQDKNAAGELFRTKIEVPFDNLPDWLLPELPVKSRRSGANGGYILFENGSSIQVSTSFRSGTLQRLHVSEHGKICAKYPQKAKELKTGTLNAIHADGIAFIESTAEGVGGDFHSMCIRSIDMMNSHSPIGRMDYKFHFYAWWQDPKYAERVIGRLVLSKHHSEYFDSLAAIGINLSDEQKNWYINKENNLGEDMKQEFPSTPLEAFLTSGRRVFPANHAMIAEGNCCKPAIVYDIDPVTGAKTKQQSLKNIDDAKAQKTLLNMLLVWELPDNDTDYAMGIDISEGLEGNDRSSISIVKQACGSQVAHWFGYLDVELLAHLSAHIGKMYNTAYAGPERNNHGHAFILEFKKIYPVSRIYQEQYIDRDDDDETAKLGWLTTKHSKPILTEGLKSLLRTGEAGIKWIGIISEINTYVYDAKGSMNAQTGCYDDQLVSYMIAQEMRARMPKTIKHSPLVRKTGSWLGY